MMANILEGDGDSFDAADLQVQAPTSKTEPITKKVLPFKAPITITQ